MVAERRDHGHSHSLQQDGIAAAAQTCGRRTSSQAVRSRPRLAWAGLLVLAVLALGGCGDREINYRLTVSIETDGGVRTGSGVIGTAWGDQRLLQGLAAGIPWYPQVHGQAVPVDLGRHGVLFVLLRGDPARKRSYPDMAPLLLGLVMPSRPREMPFEEALTLVAHHQGEVEVPCEPLPMMVRFGDIADPKTVERVDPCDLARSFGPGVRLARATIAVTDERPTTGIEAWLPWLASLQGRNLEGEKYTTTRHLAASLSIVDFKE